ncbi:hypothetical protein K501DRAFT_267837 [Backusella circina FSU 941]|nr:hypothetical protein K501DRAFT_267837 [Backusella circina FSU 941]
MYFSSQSTRVNKKHFCSQLEEKYTSFTSDLAVEINQQILLLRWSSSEKVLRNAINVRAGTNNFLLQNCKLLFIYLFPPSSSLFSYDSALGQPLLKTTYLLESISIVNLKIYSALINVHAKLLLSCYLGSTQAVEGFFIKKRVKEMINCIIDYWEIQYLQQARTHGNELKNFILKLDFEFNLRYPRTQYQFFLESYRIYVHPVRLPPGFAQSVSNSHVSLEHLHNDFYVEIYQQIIITFLKHYIINNYPEITAEITKTIVEDYEWQISM